jgi:NOL1/NOP2/fmu family ribosome biogenesis protein
MNIEIYDSKKRKKFIEQLSERFGITEIPKMIFLTGRERLRGFTGDLDINEIYLLDRITNLEFLGMYLFKPDEERSVRLGFDASIIFSEQISKNVILLDELQFKEWIRGNNLNIKLAKGMYVVRYGDDFLGCGVSDSEKLINFVPKERRLRKS